MVGSAAAQDLDLASLSLEELANVKITSVSGRAESLAEAAASIYVITAEDIRRSGATALPEALRLAPNLLVARIDTAQYAISARGFNSSIANKLLVLVDGRTVYTPLFSGVFWELQDVLLEDVERIEVISGPGATIWGANAVNGVINVITKDSRATVSSLAAVGAGHRETRAVVRHGASLGADGSFRVYAKAAELDNTERADGAHLRNSWQRAQVGFRADFDLAASSLTLQADAFESSSEHRGFFGLVDLGRLEGEGFNVLSRWTRRFADGSDLSVQAYFDSNERTDAIAFAPEAEVLDVEVQHALPIGSHRVLFGGGYRWAEDEIADGLFFGFRPRSRKLDWANLFVHAELVLAPTLELAIGVKLERNDYTGTESLPSARIKWQFAESQMLWAGVSRAVRAPSRLDRDLISPPPSAIFIRGGPNFVSEVAKIVEVGYRAQLGERLTLSSTAFHYDWDKLRSGQLPPAFIQNMIGGHIYGHETWVSWQPQPRWRLATGLSALQHDLHVEPGSLDPTGPSALGNDPELQWLVRSSHDFGERQELDVMLRRVSDLPQPVVPAYTAVDVNYAFRLNRNIALSLAVQNLFDDEHAESGAAPGRSVFPRSAYLSVTFGR